MQVTDSLAGNSAVFGSGKATSFYFADDAALFNIMSKSLYSNPTVAALRETMCNAWDAHRASNTTVLIDIELNEGVLTITDHGLGIPHDKIESIYMGYGVSSKRDDTTMTGGFGLGCKSPFAVTESFNVISKNGGYATTYLCTASDIENGGKPGMRTLYQTESEESGVTVSIPWTESLTRTHSMVKSLVHASGESVTFNGETIEGYKYDFTKPLAIYETDETITKLGVVGYSESCFIKYADVIYPVQKSKMGSYLDKFTSLCESMGYLGIRGKHCVLLAEPNTLTIAPNREELIYNQMTVDTIISLLEESLEFLNKRTKSNKEYFNDLFTNADTTNLWSNYYSQQPFSAISFLTGNVSNAYVNNIPRAIAMSALKINSNGYMFNILKLSVMKDQIIALNINQTLVQKMHSLVTKHFEFDKRTGRLCIKHARTSAGRYSSRVASTLERLIEYSYSNMLLRNLPNGFNKKNFTLPSNFNSIGFLQNATVITAGVVKKSELKERVYDSLTKLGIPDHMCESIVNSVTICKLKVSQQNEESVKAITEHFKKIGSKLVINLVNLEELPKEPKKKEPKVKAPFKGYPNLRTNYSSVSSREYIQNPVCYVNEDSEWLAKNIFEVSERGAVACVYDKKSIERLEKEGIPTFEKYIINLVKNNLSEIDLLAESGALLENKPALFRLSYVQELLNIKPVQMTVTRGLLINLYDYLQSTHDSIVANLLKEVPISRWNVKVPKELLEAVKTLHALDQSSNILRLHSYGGLSSTAKVKKLEQQVLSLILKGTV